MPPAAPLLDTVIGGCYRLTRLLGEGGMGTVYEAEHLRLGGKVAIKILSPHHAADPKFRERFRREARAASQIRHPNVVQITDFGDTPSGSVFFAMERLEGHDLHHILRKHPPVPVPWPRALHLLAQAADALAAAHRCGILHRDVKPSNIFVLEGAGLQDFVKLLDFGIAKIVVPTADSVLLENLTATGEIFGTAKYMAPEQAYGGSNDPRMDVYSLGVVAYELLTGRVPFTGNSSFEIVTRHVYDSPQSLRALRPELPAAVEAVVLRAMEKKPEGRFATMEEFSQALRAIGGSGARSGTIGSVPRARTHTDTDANTTLRRSPTAPREQIEPTMFHAPVQPSAVAAAPPARGRTIPVLGAQAALLARARTGAPPDAPAGSPPVRVPSVVVPSLAPPPTQPTSNLAHIQAPTGPLARRRGSAYDDTSNVAARPSSKPTGTSPLAVLAAIGAIVITLATVTGVILSTASDAEELAGPKEPSSVEVPAPSSDPAVVDPRPPATPSPGAVNDPGSAANEPSETVAPTPTPSTPPTADPSASTTKSPPSKPPSSKPRPRPTVAPAEPDTDRELVVKIGREIQKTIKRECWKLGSGKAVAITLDVGSDGRIGKKHIDATGALATCIDEAIGAPQFPAKARPVHLSPVIGECVDPFAAKPKCK